ncbi:MAG: ankyrin repeat domain-containing protein [Methylobacter sp.]|jgi:ankyrin repeat protein|uniref:ankyrin repeat domain-containing protein n=1 Tax=Methylobacter sp. TaxID=2051955 RepID=UPI0025DC217B|nr:ankyrin repeat domain-containing protein [Methylobacter sp.]MCK9619035.1 ankyrin repeat domain-containing protein [Methylobacter sp.]
MDAKSKLKELLKKYQQQVQFEDLELISPNQLGIDQDSPFHMACFRGDIDDVNIMIAAGADLNLYGDIGDTPLHYAVRMQREVVVEALLAAGAVPDLKNDYGDTPLDIAKIEGNQKIISLLSAKKYGTSPRSSG